MEKWRNIRYLVVDVDGTMTDGGIYYDEQGNELKKFNTRDAVGFFVAKEAKIKIIVLTGRVCKATERRLQELRVDYLFQNIKDKYVFLKNFMMEHQIAKDQIAYIGDDLNDIRAMQLVGFVGCPNDACSEVKKTADYISRLNGGEGAVRDIIEYLLKYLGKWELAIQKLYGAGSQNFVRK